MATLFTCVPDRLRDARGRIADRCLHAFPCLSDPVRRGSLIVKFGLVAFHFVAVGLLFLFDAALVEKTKKEPWYTVVYLCLLVTTIFQYFFTSGSSPGYTDELISAGNVTYDGSPISKSTSRQIASREKESLLPYAQLDPESLSSFLTKLYPHVTSRNWTCMHCKHVQPPRAKHCHDCERCVLQFDHHCVWLGTCIGQKNHCWFWWYIFEESILCTWTIILYILFLERVVHLTWWKETAMIAILVLLFFSLIFLLLLLFFHSYLILTNQTTHELLRRRRILHMRDVPVNVNPFSKGICRNLYEFCCSCNSSYIIEALPTTDELEARARPYTCLDILSCRCC